MEKIEGLIEHHIHYKEIDGYDKTIWMTPSEHVKLHLNLRKEGKCDIPVEDLTKISRAAYNRTKKAKILQREKNKRNYKKNGESIRTRTRISNKKNYEKNRKRIRGDQKTYYKENTEKVRNNKKSYYQKNKERIKAQKKENYEKNKEILKLKQREYYTRKKKGIK